MRRFFSSTWGILTFALILAFALIVTDKFGLLAPLRNVISGTLNPVQTIYTRLAKGADNFGEFFGSRRRLAEENRRLTDQLEVLSTENTELRQHIDDLAILREEREFLSEATYTSIDAHVIGRGVLPSPRIILINRGASHGVRPGFAVITRRGVLVGKVVEVTAGSAKVLAITDPKSSVAVTVLNPQKSLGIVRGSHNILAELSRIPQDDVLAIGDMVITSGTEEGIPPRLVVGTVDQIHKTDGELFQGATVVPVVEIDALSVVAVVFP